MRRRSFSCSRPRRRSVPESSIFVLWDIDGTLLRAGEVGALVFDRALERVLGIPPVTRVAMSGKTDPQIVLEYLEQLDVQSEDVLESVLVEVELELAKLADRLAAEGRVCPGAREALG